MTATSGFFARALCFATFVVACSACGGDTSDPTPVVEETPDMAMEAEDMGTGTAPDASAVIYPDFSFPPIPREVDTQAASPLRAGELLDISCRLLDENGAVVEPEEPPEFTIAVYPEGSYSRSGDDFLAIRTGTLQVRCAAADLGLVDQTPAEVEVLPGPVHTSIIEVDKYQMEAGDTVTATCRFLDEWGNEVDPATDGATPQLAATPLGGGIDVTGLAATITAADLYTMSCFVPGLSEEQQVVVEVVPGLPASIVAMAVPNQPVFGLGQVVSVAWVVSDSYGNVIDSAPVSTSVSPTSGTLSFGNGRYRFDEEGTFVVTVTVDGPTDGGGPLSQDVTVVVNGDGPGINCDDPLDGSMIDATPGQTLAFQGAVADANGVQSVLVNGSGVTVAGDGSFTANVPINWGHNFVEIVATDQFGEENSRTCSFLASDEWNAQSTYMDDSVALKLRQPAVDDGSRSGGITSLADLLHTVLNSSGLLTEVHNALVAANPLQPYTCESQTCVFGVCVCWFGWGVEYRNQVRVQGSRTVALDLVSGGVRANARINDLGVNVRVPYTVASIDGSTTGWVETSYIDVTLTLDLFLDGARNPRASVRPGSVNVQVGSVSTSFNGLDGAVVNLVIALFEGTVRGLIADTLRGFIEDSFDDVLDGLMSSLDINTLGSTFQVPQLDGTGTTDVRFNLRFSRVDANSQRLNIGVGTRLLPVLTRNSSPTLGVPVRDATIWSEPSTSRPVAVGVYVGVLNHALHALWRGGLFDATLTGSDLGGLPAGASATISASLPPVVDNLSDGTVKLGLGGLTASIVYPGIFDEPLNVALGAFASSNVSVQGDELVFGAITIDDLFFSTPTVSLDATTRGVLENFLRQIIQQYVDTSLNQSLPALPIPSFSIPSSLSQYGLPANSELGILNPTLRTTIRQYILEGTFGVR